MQAQAITQLPNNRQGHDTGTHYRSALFLVDDTQENIAQNYIQQLNTAKTFKKPIVTRLESLTAFYPAEAYHQDFLMRNPNYPYVAINDIPKIKDLERLFPEKYHPTLRSTPP